MIGPQPLEAFDDRLAVLAALPDSYGPLFDRAAAVFEADERVRATWLHGALARGAADAASDMNVSVAIADDGFDGFAASWPDRLAAILQAPPIAARNGIAWPSDLEQAVRDYPRDQGAPLA